MKNVIDYILVTEAELSAKCKELGAQITKDYNEMGEVPYVVGLLRGSVPFMAELTKYLDMDIQIDFMDVSSYSGTKSTGDIRINKDLECNVEGMCILLIEDIVDTGRTLKEVKRTLLNKGAKEVRIVTLLDKPDRRIVEVDVDYVGFEIPDEFVVGYGLDYDQMYRNLPNVGVLKRSVYEK